MATGIAREDWDGLDTRTRLRLARAAWRGDVLDDAREAELMIWYARDTADGHRKAMLAAHLLGLASAGLGIATGVRAGDGLILGLGIVLLASSLAAFAVTHAVSRRYRAAADRNERALVRR